MKEIDSTVRVVPDVNFVAAQQARAAADRAKSAADHAARVRAARIESRKAARARK